MGAENKKTSIYLKKFTVDRSSYLEIVSTYYKLVSVLYDLKLTNNEIICISEIALNMGVFDREVRATISSKHSMSFPTIYNILSRLKKNSVIRKKGSKVILAPELVPDFNSNPNLFVFDIKIRLKEDENKDG